MPKDVQDAHVDVSLHDALLHVVVHSKMPTFDVVPLLDDVDIVLIILVVVLWSMILAKSMDRVM